MTKYTLRFVSNDSIAPDARRTYANQKTQFKDNIYYILKTMSINSTLRATLAPGYVSRRVSTDDGAQQAITVYTPSSWFSAKGLGFTIWAEDCILSGWMQL